MFCTNCGYSIDTAQAAFCSSCGAKTNAVQTTSPAEATSLRQGKRAPKKVILLVLAVAAVAIAAVLLLANAFGWFGASPESQMAGAWELEPSPESQLTDARELEPLPESQPTNAFGWFGASPESQLVGAWELLHTTHPQIVAQRTTFNADGTGMSELGGLGESFSWHIDDLGQLISSNPALGVSAIYEIDLEYYPFLWTTTNAPNVGEIWSLSIKAGQLAEPATVVGIWLSEWESEGEREGETILATTTRVHEFHRDGTLRQWARHVSQTGEELFGRGSDYSRWRVQDNSVETVVYLNGSTLTTTWFLASDDIMVRPHTEYGLWRFHRINRLPDWTQDVE